MCQSTNHPLPFPTIRCRVVVGVVMVLAVLPAHPPVYAEVVERKATSTLTAVELEHGDTLRFTLGNGHTRTLVLDDTWAEILLTNLKTPKGGFGGGGTLYRFGCRVTIDGQPMTMIRYVPVQESFYEPCVVNGMRIWFDAVKKIGDLFNENHGDCLPRKAARFAIQDATQSICSEQEPRPWYPNRNNFIDVHESYNGDDVWLGPYQGADLHGGLDIDMPIGTPLWAPFGIDEQFYFDSLAQGQNNNRWRGIRRWSNGQRWVIQAHHMTRLMVAQHTPLEQGAHYAEAAGVLTGSHAHSHFVFKVGEEGAEILLDPWILFRQIFENNKRRAGAIFANIAPLEPAVTGKPVSFHANGSRPGITGNRLSCSWSFGDGGCACGENPTYTFTSPGIYPVTLVVDDGTERATATQHVTVTGPPVSSSALVLSAPDEVEFARRPVWAMDVYGRPVPHVPHSLRFLARPKKNPRPPVKSVVVENGGEGTLNRVQFQLEYQEGSDWLRVDQQGAGNAQTLQVSVDAARLTAKHGVYHARVTVTAAGAMNSPQVFFVELTTPRFVPSAEVTVDNQDETCYASPWFWVAPRFHGHWPQGYADTYLVAAGPAKEQGFVRFRPCLAAGQYEVLLDPQTPFRPTPQAAENIRFPVRVRHAEGDEVMWVEPLKSRRIGNFRFGEGNDGFVQIETKGATGLVVADAVVFQPSRPTDLKSPTAPTKSQ
jgi:PKD repeat protein